MKTAHFKFFPVRYTWQQRGKTQHGHSVARGIDQADAESRFARENPHVSMVGRESARVLTPCPGCGNDQCPGCDGSPNPHQTPNGLNNHLPFNATALIFHQQHYATRHQHETS
jgi:hypothetical protein